MNEKFAAVEEKENEIHLLQLSLREKERDVERLNNLLSHNEETINVRVCFCVIERFCIGKCLISSQKGFLSAYLESNANGFSLCRVLML